MWSESLTSTTFSTTFDRKLRLEMGWYETTSLGSKFGFFRRGRIIAFLQQCGNVTWSNDALQMAAMTVLMISLDCLISHVGAGSNRHCFAGDFKRIFAISSVVTGWKSDSSSLTTRLPILGGDDWDVDVRIRSIFVTKYCEKSSAVRRFEVWARGYIKFRSFDHSALELQASIARDVVHLGICLGSSGLKAVFFSWLGLASASHGLASVLPRSWPYCLGLGSASQFLPRSWLGLEGSALPRLGSNQST